MNLYRFYIPQSNKVPSAIISNAQIIKLLNVRQPRKNFETVPSNYTIMGCFSLGAVLGSLNQARHHHHHHHRHHIELASEFPLCTTWQVAMTAGALRDVISRSMSMNERPSLVRGMERSTKTHHVYQPISPLSSFPI